MSVFVKICGLTDADSVSAAVDAGADAVGFVFAKSVRQVTPELAAAITKHLPESVLRVAVMLHPTQAEWDVVADAFVPDVLQTDAADFGYLDVAADITRWPVFREGAMLASPAPRTFVYEGKQSGRGETVDWDRAALIAQSGNMILAGGLGPDNVADAIRRARPYGVDVSSAVEASPGRKDAKLIAAFVAAARGAE